MLAVPITPFNVRIISPSCFSFIRTCMFFPCPGSASLFEELFDILWDILKYHSFSAGTSIFQSLKKKFTQSYLDLLVFMNSCSATQFNVYRSQNNRIRDLTFMNIPHNRFLLFPRCPSLASWSSVRSWFGKCTMQLCGKHQFRLLLHHSGST